MWAAEVESQLSRCIDLVVVEAEYHRQCRQNFYSNRTKPIKSNSGKKKPGRRKHKDLHNGFIQLSTWHEQQAEAYTMKMLTESGDSYSSKWIGQKPKEHYRYLVHFASKPCIARKVFFTDMVNRIL